MGRKYRIRASVYRGVPKYKRPKQPKVSPKVYYKQQAIKLKYLFLYKADKFKRKVLKQLPKVKKQ